MYLCSPERDVVCDMCVCVLDTFFMENKRKQSSTSIGQEKTILHQWTIDRHILDPWIMKKISGSRDLEFISLISGARREGP